MEIKRVSSAEIIPTIICHMVNNGSWKELEVPFTINDLNNKINVLIRE